VIDHLDKGSLDLSKLKRWCWTKPTKCCAWALSTTSSASCRDAGIAPDRAVLGHHAVGHPPHRQYLPAQSEVTVAAKTGTNENIRQRYWLVSGMHKLDALTRILEAENFDGMIIFSRTKLGTEELAQKLQARGFSAAAINGDIQQAQRERTMQMLKDGKIDILVATDVAARGLDVERISHVVNYDVPHDPKATPTASAVPAAPAAAAKRSCSSRRAKRAC
jgi:ATP-dependent RNA helicase DeaD